MYNSTLLPKQQLLSVIEDRCDTKIAFKRIINFFDVNKNKNKKTKILDCGQTYIWEDIDHRYFNIYRTHNLKSGYLNKLYDIIIYEPPRKKGYEIVSKESAKRFVKSISNNGVVIVRTNDFKEAGSLELKGSFNVKNEFEAAGFLLYDRIVYRHKGIIDNKELPTNRSQIIHSDFLIFKEKKHGKH